MVIVTVHRVLGVQTSCKWKTFLVRDLNLRIKHLRFSFTDIYATRKLTAWLQIAFIKVKCESYIYKHDNFFIAVFYHVIYQVIAFIGEQMSKDFRIWKKKMKSAPMKYKMYNTDPMCARLINKLKEKIRRGREGKKGGFLIHKKVGHG